MCVLESFLFFAQVIHPSMKCSRLSLSSGKVIRHGGILYDTAVQIICDANSQNRNIYTYIFFNYLINVTPMEFWTRNSFIII